jgi:hypothetical protein
MLAGTLRCGPDAVFPNEIAAAMLSDALRVPWRVESLKLRCQKDATKLLAGGLVGLGNTAKRNAPGCEVPEAVKAVRETPTSSSQSTSWPCRPTRRQPYRN